MLYYKFSHLTFKNGTISKLIFLPRWTTFVNNIDYSLPLSDRFRTIGEPILL